MSLKLRGSSAGHVVKRHVLAALGASLASHNPQASFRRLSAPALFSSNLLAVISLELVRQINESYQAQRIIKKIALSKHYARF